MKKLAAVVWVGLSLLIGGCAANRPALANADLPVTPDEVRAEFRHAWAGYKKYAWGADALHPISRRPRNWYSHSLLMTPVDGFDTMVIMGLTAERAEAKELILKNLSFDYDMSVQHFEISIRILGGLLSAYELDGDPRFLALAKDLADRMLPVFNSPTGMPYRYVNLRTGQTSGSISGPAEVGTYVLEYGVLSRLTGNPVYFEKAKLAMMELHKRRNPTTGLVGAAIDVDSGRWLATDVSVGGGVDSYFEYLLKGSLLFNDPDLKKMWAETISAINAHLAEEVNGRLWYGHADMNTGRITSPRFGSLDAFFPALLALGGDLDRAARLEHSCLAMWNMHGIEPEIIDYRSMTALVTVYPLRPEIVESAYYLYHYTGDEEYRRMGRVFWRDTLRRCRTDAGFSGLIDVRTGLKSDQMESFFFAETLKYYFLLFSPPSAFDFDAVIFNTEAHPYRLKPAE
jgi:ER degradation enhancer, mannosidase alpha-like 2